MVQIARRRAAQAPLSLSYLYSMGEDERERLLALPAENPAGDAIGLPPTLLSLSPTGL